MYCKKCGKQISDDSKFCRYCGSEQDSSVEQIAQTNIINDKVDKVIEAPKTITEQPQAQPKGNRLVRLFLWSITICVICTIGYAVIRSEDSTAYDSEHYYGSSVYDPESMSGGTIESVHENLTWFRKDGYERGIKKMVIYSFTISFGILILGAILTGTMNKK